MHPTTHGRVPQDVAPPVLSRRVLVATLIGNFTEWFDFAVYGAVAVTLGRVFFPLDGPCGVPARLAGGVRRRVRPAARRRCTPRLGRRPATAAAIALSVAVLGISVATTSIALLPTYATAGLLGAGPARPAALCPGTRRRAASGPARRRSSSSTPRRTAAGSGRASSRRRAASPSSRASSPRSRSTRA